MFFRIQVFSQLLQQQQQNPMGWFGSVIGSLFGLAFGIIELVAMWKVFTKANQPGWAVLIPIYNLYVLLEIVGRPWWWLLLLLIPGVNFVISIILVFDLAKSFGKGTGFGFGLLFLNFIFVLILAFGDAQYVGPVASE